MLDGINPQAAAFAANQAHQRSEPSPVVTANSEHEEKVTESRRVRTTPEQDRIGADGRQRDSFELSPEAEQIRQLEFRDREVRAHEAAHAATGGAHAGSPSYTFERGPDGQSYAVGGEVGIDMSPISGDPQATLKKAQQVRAAALAPAEPSGQDLQVAQRAQAMAAKARSEISQEQSQQLGAVVESAFAVAGDDGDRFSGQATSSAFSVGSAEASVHPGSGFARLSVHA